MTVDLYNELMAAALNAKTKKDRVRMNAVYGALSMAHFLGAITASDWKEISKVVLEDCLNNPNWTAKKPGRFSEYATEDTLTLFVINRNKLTVTKIEMPIADLVDYELLDDAIEDKVKEMALKGIIMKEAYGELSIWGVEA